MAAGALPALFEGTYSADGLSARFRLALRRTGCVAGCGGCGGGAGGEEGGEERGEEEGAAAGEAGVGPRGEE